jgi:hypothetical protein
MTLNKKTTYKPEIVDYQVVARIYVDGRKTVAYINQDGWHNLPPPLQRELIDLSNAQTF